MNFLGMGPLELLFIGALALVVFGPEKLPELARHAGRLVGEVRRASAELGGEIQQALSVDSPGTARTGPASRPSTSSSNLPAPGSSQNGDGDGLVPPY